MTALKTGLFIAVVVISGSLSAAAGDAGFNKSGDAVSGKYVSYSLDRNNSSINGYTISSSGSTVLWFDSITVSGFNAEAGVDIHDNSMGTMLIDTVQAAGAGASQRPGNYTKYRLKINISLGGNVTLEKKYAGTITRTDASQNAQGQSTVTFQPASNVNITGMEGTDNGIRLRSGEREAYLSGVSSTGGAPGFTIQGNRIIVDVNNSLLLFRQLVSRDENKSDPLDTVIMQGISEGKIGAEFFIDSASSYDAVSYGSVNASVEITEGDSAVLNVSSDTHEGTVITVNLENGFYNNKLNKSLSIEFDGSEINAADNYTDIMDVSDDSGRAEYLIAAGYEGTVVLISIPGFSHHMVALKLEPPRGAPGASAARLTGSMQERLGVYLPVSGRESAFGMWWIMTVTAVYVLFRRTIRDGK